MIINAFVAFVTNPPDDYIGDDDHDDHDADDDHDDESSYDDC